MKKNRKGGDQQAPEAKLNEEVAAMKKFLGEFKEFALRGNVMDLAIGVIIGAAFQGVVTSLTDNILSPIIGLVTGQDFSNALKIPLTILGSDATINIGAFITTVINFVIMAFVIFLLVKGMNKLAGLGKKEEPQKAPDTKKCPFCFTDIPAKATRCPNCTAQLPPVEAEKTPQA